MAKDEQFVQVLQYALKKAQAEQKLTVAELLAEITDKLKLVVKKNE